jgi:hypothetical protein
MKLSVMQSSWTNPHVMNIFSFAVPCWPLHCGKRLALIDRDTIAKVGKANRPPKVPFPPSNQSTTQPKHYSLISHQFACGTQEHNSDQITACV